MYVDQTRKLIFIHNPKTAGMSIVRSFGFPSTGFPNKFNHTRPQEAITWIFQQTWTSFYSFCVVRNPWDRLVSLYHFQRSDNYARIAGLNLSHQRARALNFSQWIDVNIGERHKSLWFGVPQSDWSSEVSEAFRYEDLDTSLPRIAATFGLRWDGALENITPHPHYRSLFNSPSHIDFVAQLECQTIARFNYDF
ncbi:MAG: sulfotransferase family 2 domain-containing protein [Sphingorhabdus sp.]|uniref:sulfotransferase family 2 domain-containing protein n=1 Tax=Sphingorhabdus sp. TaxID=1902408 RepID=UPI003CBCB237